MKNKKSKSFLNIPQYPGGKTAFQEFIRLNLRYPPEALRLKIEGKVNVSYEVNDNGEVVDAMVTHGLGYGCDEEALRVIRLLQYDKVRNRGVRLTSTMKTTIIFKLPQVQQVSYNYSTKPAEKKEEKDIPKPGQGQSYTITIKFNG